MSKFPFCKTAQKGMSREVPLPQLRSERDVSKFRFRNHAVDGSVFKKFHNSAQGVIYHGEVSLPHRNCAVEGNVFIQFHFRN